MSDDIDIILGIDLGTTFSAVASMNAHGKPQMIPNSEGKRTTPSVVFFQEDGTPIVGELARNQALVDPTRTVQFIKREMGNPSFRLSIDGLDYYPEGISALILKKLRSDAEAALGRDIRQAVISVPAYFKDAQRRATQVAGEIAGLEVIAIVNEPTAAALAYGFGKHSVRQNLLVYDFGGGTFDVTILRVDGNEFTVLATDGDSHLGGIDVDQRLVDYMAEQFQAQHQTDLRADPYTRQDLLERAERAKIDLSSRQSVMVTLAQGSAAMRLDLSREQLAELTADLVQRTVDCMQTALESAVLTWNDIDVVLLAGGSSRMICVRELLRRVSGKEPSLDINPDECVALGAAIRSITAGVVETEAGDQPLAGAAQITDIVIRDVAPHSLGVKALNAEGRPTNSIIIPRLTPVPCERRRTYATRVDNQKSIEIEVLQGEDPDPFSPQVDLIGKVEMHDLPPGLAGEVIVAVTLRYDADAVVEVVAEELTGGRVVREQLLRKMGELGPELVESIKEQFERDAA
jgi:molecular chaperone DnaK